MSDTKNSKEVQVWGVWNGQGWIRTNSGRDYKTDKKEFAESIAFNLIRDGASGIEVRNYEIPDGGSLN